MLMMDRPRELMFDANSVPGLTLEDVMKGQPIGNVAESPKLRQERIATAFAELFLDPEATQPTEFDDNGWPT